MQPTDNNDPVTQQPEFPPRTEHMFESSVPLQTDHLITGDNEKVYAFHHSHKHLSLRQRFGLLSRTRQVLLVGGSLTVIFIFSMIMLTFMMYEPPKKSNTIITTRSSVVTEDLNKDGAVDTEDAIIATGDANKDGAIDEKDLVFVNEDSSGDKIFENYDPSNDTRGELAWWQELILKIRSGNSSPSENSEPLGYDSTVLDDDDDFYEYEYPGEEYDSAPNDSVPSESEETQDGTVPEDIKLSEVEPTDVVVAPSSSAGSTYTIASWNVYGANKQNVGSRAKDILKGAQVLGLQEVHGSTKMNQIKSAACSSCAYDVYMPSSGDSYPIMWDRSVFTKVDQGSQYMSSPPGLSKRYAVWVKLQNKKTGKSSYVINTHFAPSVESRGDATNSKYTPSYKTHMSNLVSLIRGKKSANIPLFVTGDFNVNFRRDCKVSYFPCRALAQDLSVPSGWALTNPKYSGISSSQGTHSNGDRLIDYVMAWKRSDVVANKSTILGGGGTGWGGSDHKPSLLSVTVR